MLRTDKYFELITTVVRCEELCRPRRMLSTAGLQPRARVDNILLELHNSPPPTQPHSIIVN